MSLNIQKLISALEQKQNSISSPLDIMTISKAIDTLRLNKVNYVEKFSALPDPTTTPLGTLYYVGSEEQSLFVLTQPFGSAKGWKNLKDDTFVLMSWGNNSQGALGLGCNTGSRNYPSYVLGQLTDWCDVSAGNCHSAAIRTNGTLWTWGRGASGRLGNCSNSDCFSPVLVSGGFTDWCQVSAGGAHTAAVRTDGTLWTWGTNSNGQLGNNTTVNRSSPGNPSGGFTDWCQVSAGDAHTAAVRQNGTLWTWGANSYGELGDGTTVTKSSPVSVVGGYFDWCQVGAGTDHTVALRTNGTLWSWGRNATVSRLGDGTTVDRSSPVSVVGGFTDWCQVSVFADTTVALRTNGTLWSWGRNDDGQLGDNSLAPKCSPVSVVGGIIDWCYVSAGLSHTTAIRTDGTVWTWGSNNSEQLGDGTNLAKSSPITPTCPYINWNKVSAGRDFTIAVRNSGKQF